MKKGLLIVISGPAGSGKGTVNAKLLQSDEYVYSVSATTRAPRPGERDGVNYYFITREEFERRIQDGEMLEYTEYCGNYYGTPLREAKAVLESGRNLILEIEVEGALNVKRIYPDAVLIMLLPPTYAVQEQRLRDRGTETEQKILERLERTKVELQQLPHYDYVVYNHDGGVDRCAEDIRTIAAAERNAEKGGDCAIDRFRTAQNPDAAKRYFAV